MERTEILELLREGLSIGIELDDSYECDSRYITCRVVLRLDGEDIASDEDTVTLSFG
jgi:hypothetical protein